ncbi:hypothetical protein AURDEDRAFT_163998 [Auricularia subglabra TFB-10046 SS5]|nr:hypothetical protein AURDEDRAFT_163998 [Auricularia subglabra TFB-10046 SS5]
MSELDPELLRAMRVTFLAAAIISSALFGTYLTLASATIWKLHGSKSLPRDTFWCKVTIIIALALLFAVHFSSTAVLAYGSLMPALRSLPRWPMPTMLLAISLSLAIGDALFIYRCWIIWSRSRWVWLPISFLLAELCGAAVDFSKVLSRTAEHLMLHARGPFSDPQTAVGAVTVSLTVALNVLLTLAAVARLLYLRRNLRRFALPAGGAHYSRICLVLAFSTLLYSAGWLPIIFRQNGIAAPPYWVSLFALVAITPLFVMLRVGSDTDNGEALALPRIEGDTVDDKFPVFDPARGPT